MEPALEALRIHLRDMLCVAAGAPDAAFDPAGGRDAGGASGGPAEGAVLEALGAVDAAMEGVGRNLNPQATTALLLEEMGAAFAGRATGRMAGTPQFAGVLRSL